MPDNNEQLFQLINSQDIEVSNDQINKTVSLNIRRGLNNVIILTPEEYNKLQNIDEKANRIFHNLEINTDNSKTIKKFTEEHPEGEIISVPVGSKLASHSYTELLDELNNADLDFVKIENQNFIETLLNSGINLIGGESKLNEITLTEEEENGLNEQEKEEKLRLKKLSIITDTFVSRLKTIYPSVMFNDDLPEDPIIGSLCYVYNDKCFYTYNSNGWASTSSEILSALSNLDNIDTILDSKANKDVATSNENGLMSSIDKIKLDNIPNNINFTSENAEENGETLSLVTTGEKYVWNSKTSNTGTVTQITTGEGLTGGNITSSGTISLATSGVTAGTKGATANVTGTEGTTIKVPQITVDTYGRVTSLEEFTLTNKNTIYSDVTAIENAPSGLMTSADKIKLDSLSIIPRSDYDLLTNEDKVNIRLFFVVESDNTVTMIYNPINTPSEP